MHLVAPKPGQLLGRNAEARGVADLVAGARAGRGGALVLKGEAGIGKSALLDAADAAASGFTVVRASGAEFEQELPYAALHQLCVPVLNQTTEIPAALRVAFGLAPGTPEPFRVGLAMLELMTTAARTRPLLCVVDDAHWLDTASRAAMAFLARRIAADPIAVVFAVRIPAPLGELATLPQLLVAGLSDENARQLLTIRSPFPLDERVRDRLVAEAHGNPLALLELPRAGGFAPPETASVPSRVEHAFRRRLATLTGGAHTLLLLASADPTGDPELLWSSAEALQIDVSQASADAEATELAEFGMRIRFCHPLARSAVYRAASPEERRIVHGVLADVTDAVTAPDRKAWHRAQAAVSPDDDVAGELARSAARAQARGGVAAAAAFLERSAELSPDADRRIGRTLDAAQAHIEAGSSEAAGKLLTTVETAVLDDVQRSRLELLQGRIAFLRPGDGTGPALIARAAQRLSDPVAARECYLDALEMSLVVGRGGGFVTEILAKARAEAPETEFRDVLDALITLAAGDHATAIQLLKGDHRPMWNRWPSLATMIATQLWDPHTLTAIAEHLVKVGRESGSPLLLRLGLAQKATDASLTGDLGQALAAVAEEGAIADAAGEPPLVYPRLQVAAFRGRRDEANELFVLADRAVTADGAGQVTNLHWATAVLNNGLGDYPAALAAARAAVESPDLFHAGPALVELIEAAVRCREHRVAATALESLTVRTEASGTATGLGVAAYARGLVTGVEDSYREAVSRLAETPLLPYRGRAHLLYGEWLRRQNRRRDGVEQLRIAHELLSAAGAEAFARRAADELRAAGEQVDRHAQGTDESLTLQELAVARRVAHGATSNEVAVALFVSKRTVDAHLRNIFRKLGISSRRQLKDRPELLPSPGGPAEPASAAR
ncbi:AAA family ATPase [Cryptosporangium sp. NPDC048952]|uniref:AAA family ATPase n=1 Tax=Cryptosporangium sp. NPDC048952 TaxID=3363961 RepID=UPI003724A510